MGRKGRGDTGRHEGRPERPDGGRQDAEIGYKDRVHEHLGRMDQRLERHLKGEDA